MLQVGLVKDVVKVILRLFTIILIAHPFRRKLR